MGNAIMLNREKKFELIERTTTGYTLLTAEPADWATNFSSYFRNSGTAKEQNYTAITGTTPPAFETGKYYSYSSAAAIFTRSAEPDGTPYNFQKVLLSFRQKTGTASIGRLQFELGSEHIWEYTTDQNISFDRGGRYLFQCVNGYIYGNAASNYSSGMGYIHRVLGDSITRFLVSGFPGNIIVEIYGVRI